jgi:hypothetical protein
MLRDRSPGGIDGGLSPRDGAMEQHGETVGTVSVGAHDR